MLVFTVHATAQFCSNSKNTERKENKLTLCQKTLVALNLEH